LSAETNNLCAFPTFRACLVRRGGLEDLFFLAKTRSLPSGGFAAWRLCAINYFFSRIAQFLLSGGFAACPPRRKTYSLFWKLESYFCCAKPACRQTGRKEITVRWANAFSRMLSIIVKTRKWLFLKHLIVLF
jgi:hypothetical protein